MKNTQKVIDALRFIQNLEMTSLEMQMLISELADISDGISDWCHA